MDEIKSDMKYLNLFILISVLLVLTACYNNKYAPQIQSILVDPDSVLVSENILLTCVATDGDSDPMSYSWSCTEGAFIHGSTGASVTWQAPEEPGEYKIEVSVDDGTYTTNSSIVISCFIAIEDNGSFEYFGREYTFATIGQQTWMTDNLAYLPEVADPLDGSEDDAFYYVYDYHGSHVDAAEMMNQYEIYGVLYNWPAAMNSCPDGWHLPSDDEWKTLERYLGMGTEVDEREWRDEGSVGKKMKTTTGWKEDGNGNNLSGFSAKPGGLKTFSGKFSDNGGYGNFWSSTLEDPSTAWYRYLGHPYDGINRNFSSKRRGFSVRCVRD